MFRSAKMLIPVAALALVIAGCSGDQMPTQNFPLNANLASAYSLPAGATLQSATFYVFIGGVPSDQHVNVHRITSDWDELTVTWNSFGSAWDPTATDGFMADMAGWRTANVTSLVSDWLDGTYDNYGLLLDQDNLEWPRTLYGSNTVTEWPAPWLELCYTLNGNNVCDTIMADADTYISESEPNTNFGTSDRMYTGRFAEGEPNKRALVWFDLSVDQPEYAAIGDRVWYDDNMNGIQDEGEMGVAGVTVHLMDCAGNVLDEMLTDANGYYLFDMLTPGNYNIHFVLPAGYVWTLQDQGADDAVDSDADAMGSTICTELVGGETDLTWDAGIYMPEQNGCSRTIGYWKTHAGFGPQADMVTQYLPIWLGTMGGAKSVQVTDAGMAVSILSGSGSNGIQKLMAQLLATKLNLAAGASGTDLGTAVADADAFLAMYSAADWSSLTNSQKQMVNSWKDLFDAYNNGCIGPGHCDDDPYGEDCED